ncbi:unnamed protein product [Effrenium voratum]|nr:unnamed protein product [Effrenium voratum]
MPKPELLPYLPTLGSIRSRKKLDRSVARWRPTSHHEDVPSLARRLAGSASLPALPSVPPSGRQAASMVNLWRDAGDLLRGKEAELPMLVPPPAHRVLGLGKEADGKPPKLSGRTSAGGPARSKYILHAALAPEVLSKGARLESKRFSQQGALATDGAYVAQQLARQAEGHKHDEPDAHQEADRWWCAVFLPLPRPRQLLPSVLVGQRGLVGETPSFDQRSKVEVKLTPDELEELGRLCASFAKLVLPPPVEGEEAAVLLSRPCFCQLLLAMGLTSLEKCFVPHYHRAVQCFDAEAVSCDVHSVAPYGRITQAVRLPALPDKVDESSLEELMNDRQVPRLARLFGRLLEELAAHPFWEGQEMAEAIPRAKKYFFFKMVPAAQAFSDARLRLLQKKAASLEEPSRGSEMDATKRSRFSVSSAHSFVAMDSSSDLPTEASVDSQNSSPPKLQRTNSVRSIASSGSRRTSTSRKRESLVRIVEEPKDEPEPEVLPTVLPAEVVKAEFLQNQLLEPEVVAFVAMFSGIFQVLFETYCDFPARGATEGHMTISAFLRFCFDLGLFPSVIDLQSLQRLYGYSRSKPSPCPPQRRRRPKREPKAFFWNGLQVPQRFEWLTKEFAQHNAEETACVGLLGAIHDWMKDRMWTPSDVFALLDWNGNGGICGDEFVQGLKLLQLDHLPEEEELYRLIPLLLNEAGHVTPYELQQALAVVAKQKHKLELAANFFLKADRDMSPTERNASVFFRDLIKVMEKNNWTPQRLFEEFGSGQITKDELESKAKILLVLHCGRSAALEVAQPFDVLDVNGDGVIEEEEFVAILAQLSKALSSQGIGDVARQRRQLQAALAAVTWSVAATRAQVAAGVAEFSLPQFIECLLLIAFEVVGIRGTSLQAQQPTVAKAVWLLLYLRWQYELKLQDAQNREPSAAAMPTSPGVHSRSCQYSPPLQRLFRDYPELFKDAPCSKTPAKAKANRCAQCGRVPHLGWGSLACSHCSDADAVLKACWKSNKDTGGERVSLISSALTQFLPCKEPQALLS